MKRLKAIKTLRKDNKNSKKKWKSLTFNLKGREHYGSHVLSGRIIHRQQWWKNKIVLTLEWISEMNERKYACQSVGEINNGKFKKDGEITSG